MMITELVADIPSRLATRIVTQLRREKGIETVDELLAAIAEAKASANRRWGYEWSNERSALYYLLWVPRLGRKSANALLTVLNLPAEPEPDIVDRLKASNSPLSIEAARVIEQLRLKIEAAQAPQ